MNLKGERKRHFLKFKVITLDIEYIILLGLINNVGTISRKLPKGKRKPLDAL